MCRPTSPITSNEKICCCSLDGLINSDMKLFIIPIACVGWVAVSAATHLAKEW